MQEEEQSNRPHKINQKLEKRRKNEKKHVKEKKQKKKENQMKKKQKIVKEKDQDEINYKKLKKVIQKFLQYYKDNLQDFYDIFANLDEPQGSIDISGLEDKVIRKRLYQMFKYLKLDFNSENSEYKKPDRIKQLCIRRLIQKQVEKVLESKEKYESDENNENSPSQNPQNSNQISNTPQPIINPIQPAAQPTQPIQLAEPQQPALKETECLPQPQPKQYGPSLEFLKRVKNAQENIEQQQEKQNWLGENKNLDSFLNETFAGIENKGQLDSYLSKRVTQKNQKTIQVEENNIDQSKYLGAGAKPQLTEEQEKIQQEEIKEFMKEYDDQYRSKSLLEEHRVLLQFENNKQLQEQKKQKKANKTKPERRPFDRDNDLRIIQCDTNKLFKMINGGQNSLSNRFATSQYQNNFI